MKISPARVAAYEVLVRVERERGFSSALLPKYEAGLDRKDRALCHEIVLGVLRRQLLLDDAISRISGKKRIDLEVLICLRIGAYQLLYLDRIPAHSAVNESVALVQRARKASAKGFVNAILRKISTDGVSGASSAGGLDPISVSHPQWLLERWEHQFGTERAMAIAAANNEPAPVAFRVTNRGVEHGYQLPGNVHSSVITERAYLVERLTDEIRASAESGDIYFQDEGSQLIANGVSISPDEKFLDVCAAPGGKTTQIAAHTSALIAAGDLYQPRVKFVRSNALRQGVPNVYVVRYDAETALPFADGSFDSVLVDAPCTGTGTIRSNPEIRYFLQPDDIAELSSKQLDILRNASKLVKAGGRLYYSTCSLEREENEKVIERFMGEQSEFVIEEPAVDRRFITPQKFARTYPERDATDGFFLAVMTRNR